MANYPWQRAWYELEHRIPIDERSGYLRDRAAFGDFEHQETQTISTVAQNPCLILLGDSGSGKSTSMEEAYQAARTAQPEESIWFDLKGLREESVRRYLFEQPAWRGWKEGLRSIELFLDSLDECYMRLADLPAVLIQELRTGPLNRLRLRIACRTAIWPTTLGEQLSKLWPDGTKTFVLAPLRRQDVLLAAQQRVPDAEGFLARVEQSGASPLAAMPQTLELLFRLETGGQFPKTRAELFDKGCRKLCEEPDPSRWDQARAGHTPTPAGPEHSQRRFQLASQLAAMNLFCSRPGVWLGPPSESPDGYLCPGIDFSLDELGATSDELRDLGRAPLFRLEQPDSLTWAHRSYCEFLAARFAIGLLADKVPELLIHPESPGVIPQLAGVAAWMASQNPTVFQMLMQRDPQVLVAADLGLTSSSERRELVGALLAGFEAGRLRRDFELQRSYFKLDHPSIAEQLHPVIADRSLSELTRYEAIMMAKGCNVTALHKLLVEVALAHDENRIVRVAAALAIARTDANVAIRAKLLPLARGEAGADPEDELKGYALEALWQAPRQIEPAEMFTLLTPPKEANLLGAYRGFLEYTLVHRFEVGLLPHALAWLQQHRPASGEAEPFEPLVQAVLGCGLSYLTDSILPSFARVLCWRLESHDQHIFGRDRDYRSRRKPQILLSPAKRRKLIDALVRLDPPPQGGVYHSLSRHVPPLIEREDEAWLVDRIEAEQLPEVRAQWAKLIREFSNFDDRLHEVAWRIPELLEEFGPWLKPVEISSPQAERLRESKRQIDEMEAEARQRTTERKAKRVYFEPSHVEECLQRCETGDIDAFWQLNMRLLAPPEGKQPGWEIIPDLTRLPGWDALTPAAHARIREAAQDYLLAYTPCPCEKWFNGQHLYRPEMAGYRALLLLQAEFPTYLSQLPPEIWSKWAHVIIGYPLADNTWGTPAPHQQLVAAAYESAPQSIIQSVIRLVDGAEQQGEGELYDLWKLELCRDARMGQALFDLARRDPPRRTSTLGHLLRETLIREGNHHSDVQRFAESFLPLALSSDSESRQRAIIAGRVLVIHMPNASFSAVWSTVTQDATLGMELMERVASNLDFPTRHSAAWAASLTEAQIALLWQWLRKQYPHDEDPEVNGFHGPRHMISDLRDGLFSSLVGRGTKESCLAIEKLCEEHPKEKPWLCQALLRAQENYRTNSWEPLSPAQLLSLLKGTPMICHVALLTAVDVETRAVLDVLREEGVETALRTVEGRPIHFFTLKQGNKSIQACVAQATDKRSQAAQSLVQDIVRNLHPELILSVGFCGGFADRVKENDVIVARGIFHYEPEQIVEDGHGKRPQSYKGSARVIDVIKALKATQALDGIMAGAQLHTDKDFASGDKTIKDDGAPLRQYIHDLSIDIYGFEQEGPGLLHAMWELVRNPQWAAIQVGMIKCVTDLGDTNMNTDKEKRQAQGTQRAARIAIAVLRQFWS